MDAPATPFLGLLGVARAELGGRELRFPDRKCVAILALLALDGPCTRARVADLLWDAQPEARRNLRRELHRLRDAGFEPFFDADGDALALRPAVRLDTAAFEGDALPPSAALLEGFDLGAAEPFHDWLAARRGVFAQRWRALAEARCQALQAAGDTRGALALALRIVESDPLQEAAWRRAMALHGALGEREAALALYERCRKLLGRELGLKPLAETAALAERLRAGGTAPAAAAPATLPSLGGPAPLVGRDALLDALQAALAEPLVLLRGAAGIGKSRLLAALAARRPGLVVHAARQSDRHVPFAALARWLRAGVAPASLPVWVADELARLMPELGASPPPLAGDAQRLRFFEALAAAWQSAFGHAPAVFDDWQFVDEASAGWWAWWFGRRDGAPVLVAERPQEALPATAAALSSVPARVIDVPPLDEAALLALVQRLSGAAEPRRFAHRLWQATGGHPFYAVETLQHLLQSGVIRVDAAGQWHTPFDDATTDYRELPIAPSVQAAVLQRVRALGDATQRLVDAASLVGDDFSLALVGRASALGEWDALQALEAALQARVLARGANGRLRFEHDLIAQAVAGALGPERRTLLHRALAQSLAEDGAAPARVAAHFEAAGDTPGARTWHRRALRLATEGQWLAEALHHAERLHALAAADDDRARAELARVFVYQWQSRPDASKAALARAAALVTPAHPPALRAELLDARAMELMREGRMDSALALLTEALPDTAFGIDERARLLRRRGMLHRNLSRHAEACADFDEAIALLGDEPTPMLAELLDSRSRVAVPMGAYDQTLAMATRAAAVAEACGHPAKLAAALMMCGAACQMLGRFDEALPVLQRARAIAARHGLVVHERSVILNLVAVLLALGRRAEALRACDEGWALAPAFSGGSEHVAFVEARFQCRLDNGELGLALESLRELVVLATSTTVQIDNYRRASALGVAADLLLALGDGDAAQAPLQAALHEVGAAPSVLQVLYVHERFARAALLAGDPAEARRRLDRAQPDRPEARAYGAAVRVALLLASGDVAAAAALPPGGSEAEVTKETWAIWLAQALATPAREAWRAAALAAAQDARTPPLPALMLWDALAAAGEPLPASARALAARLRASLAGWPREQALLARRYPNTV